MGAHETDLSSIAEELVKKALLKGADEAEAYVVKSSTEVIEESPSAVRVLSNQYISLSLRVAIGKKVGGSTVNFLIPKTVEKIVDRIVLNTIKNAKIAREDKRFVSFPYPTSGCGFSVFDPSIADVDESELSEVMLRIRKMLGSLEKLRGYSVSLELSCSEAVVVNSNGMDRSDSGTIASLAFEVEVGESGLLSEATDSLICRTMNCLLSSDVENTIVEAYERALKVMRGRELDSWISGNLIIANRVVPEFLWPLGQHLSYLEVIEGRSKFSDKLRERIASKKLTIIDDGVNPQGPSASKYDGEGIPKGRTLLVDSGVLRNFIKDTYSSYFKGLRSTGNAHRIEDEVYPDLWDVVIPGRDGCLEDLISKVDFGFLVLEAPMGTHTVDATTGDFSLTFDGALMVKDGEVVGTVRPLTVSGNFFELLKNIEMVGSDAKITSWGIVPSIVVSGQRFR